MIRIAIMGLIGTLVAGLGAMAVREVQRRLEDWERRKRK